MISPRNFVKMTSLISLISKRRYEIIKLIKVTILLKIESIQKKIQNKHNTQEYIKYAKQSQYYNI